MFLRIVLFIQLKGINKGAGRGLELSFFKGDAISVGGKPDTEDIMFIKDEISFLFHPEHIVDPVTFGVSLVLGPCLIGIIANICCILLGKNMKNQGRSE